MAGVDFLHLSLQGPHSRYAFTISLKFVTPKSKSAVLNSLTGAKLHVVKLVISFFLPRVSQIQDIPNQTH